MGDFGLGNFGQNLRTSSGGTVSIRRVVGYEDPYTTIVIQSGTRWAIRGFTYSLGNDVPGLTDGRVFASRAETNLSVASELSDESEWLGLEMGIPVASPARFQAVPDGGDYPVSAADVAQFVTKAHVALYTDGDRAFASYTASTLDVRQSTARFYQQLTFRDPLRYRKNGKLWLEVDWPGGGTPPVFGTHPKTGKPGVLTVVFKLLTKLPQGTDAAPVEIKADLASVVDLIREQNQRLSELIARMPRVDTQGYAAAPSVARQERMAAGLERSLASGAAAVAEEEERAAADLRLMRAMMAKAVMDKTFSGPTPPSSVAEGATRTEGNTTDADSPIDAERFRGLEKGDRT